MVWTLLRLPGGFARRAAVLCVLALLPVGAGAAEAQPPPALVLSPTNGTPGSVVSFAGSGFCGQRNCSTVSVLFAGTPVAEGIAVAGDGAFRGSFKVPGGGVVGTTNVTATQTTADGYELRAFAQFDLVFGKGEDAEFQAEIHDLVAKPSESVLQEGVPRGVPFESLAAGITAAPPQDDAAETAARESTISQVARSNAFRWFLGAATALLLGGAAALASRRLRRSRPGRTRPRHAG